MADRNPGHAFNVVMKAYLDNVIESGRALEDLPEDEMHALRSLVAAAKAGELELVTSRESWREQERTQDVAKRAQLEAARNMERSADAVVVPCRSRGDPRWCLQRGRGGDNVSGPRPGRGSPDAEDQWDAPVDPWLLGEAIACRI